MPAISCATCSHLISAEGNDRLPPWCPRCGADCKPHTEARKPATAAPPAASGHSAPDGEAGVPWADQDHNEGLQAAANRDAPGGAADRAATRPVKMGALATWSAVVVGAGLALVVAFLNHNQRTEGYVRLSYRQAGWSSGGGDTLRFDLPAGWWVKHNGHQPRRGGTVGDPAGRPRIEVWLFEGEPPPQPGAEVCEFPWGQVRCLTWLKQMNRPFLSFPAVVYSEGSVVERAFLLDRGYVTFRVVADQDDELQPIIWECMRSLRRGGK